MNKKKLALFGLPILALALISAALLTYYGQTTQEITVSQAVLLDGAAGVEYVEDVITDGVAGQVFFSSSHWLTNKNPDDKIIVNLESKVNGVSTYDELVVLPEYKLDATADCSLGEDYHANDDDSVSIKLNVPMTWGDFENVTFDYNITSGKSHTPQMNIKLVDGEGNFGGYVTWHAKWLDRIGEVGVKNTIVNAKLASTICPGPVDTTATCEDCCITPCIRCFESDWSIIDCTTLSDSLTFDSFSINAGDTSYCNDKPNAWGGTYGNAEQIVYVSDFKVNSNVVVGEKIILSSETLDNLVIGNIDFKLIYDFNVAAPAGTYNITTEVQPVA